MKRDFHECRKRLETAIKSIKTSEEISKRNKTFIVDFLQFCKVEGISDGRTVRYAQTMKRIAIWLKKDFDTANRKDIEIIVGKIIECDNYKEWAKHLYKVSIKKFYKWMNNGEYPDKVKWIRCTVKNANQKLPEEVLTEDEIKNMLEASEHTRDKAFISVLYESGCRIGEIAGLRIKHVAFDEYGASIVVDGKTGMRRIRLIASTPYLSSWINNHPHRKDMDYALWVSIGTRDHGLEMKYDTYKQLLRSIAKKARISKKVNPQFPSC